VAPVGYNPQFSVLPPADAKPFGYQHEDPEFIAAELPCDRREALPDLTYWHRLPTSWHWAGPEVRSLPWRELVAWSARSRTAVPRPRGDLIDNRRARISVASKVVLAR